MGTRGIIAKVTPTGWRGRYHHWDSYPSGLGKALWNLAHGHFANRLDKMMKVLVNEHTGWSTIVNKDFQYAPAYIDHGSVAAEVAESFEAKIPQCYCHGTRTEPGWLVTDKSGGTQEWGYVIDPKLRTMDVLWGNAKMPEGMKSVWKFVEKVSFDAPEPDWTVLECGRQRERCSHYDWVHDKTICRDCNGTKHRATSGHSGGFRSSYAGEDHSKCVTFENLPEPLKTYVAADPSGRQKGWHFWDPRICASCAGTGKANPELYEAEQKRIMAELDAQIKAAEKTSAQTVSA